MTTIYIVLLMISVAISASLIFALVFNDRRHKDKKSAPKAKDSPRKLKDTDTSRYAVR